MHHVGQEGRDDAVAVLDASSLPSSRSRYGGLAGAAALTLAFAEALRVRSAETALLTNKEKTKRTPRAARTLDRLRGVQPPSRLMLAHYPGTKTPARGTCRTWTTTRRIPAPTTARPVCARATRAVTAILYLNPDWEEAHGGCLRVRLEDEKGEVDVAPAWGSRRAVRQPQDHARGEARASRAVGAHRLDQRRARRRAVSVGGAFVAARSVVTAVPNERRADGPRPRSSRVTKRKQACVWLCVS